MTNTTTTKNRELTDAELLDVCGGAPTPLDVLVVGISVELGVEAAAKAASSAAGTIVKAF